MNTIQRAKSALWHQSGLSHDSKGYLDDPDPAANLLPGVKFEPIIKLIKDDFGKGSGNEWLGKIRAIHSSSALAANSFGCWREDQSSLSLLVYKGFQSLAFEAHCPTGLGGTPPNLDVLLKSSDFVIGIESKLLEPLSLKTPRFSASYSRDRLPFCEDAWWNLLQSLRHDRPSHVDSAQLVKHYLGLRKQFQDGREIVLLYLFWKPLNADDFPEYAQHADDLCRFQEAVAVAPAVKFIAMDYLSLWHEWEKQAGMAQHAKRLQARYAVEI